MCHVDPGERGLGKGQGQGQCQRQCQQGEGKLQVKFRPALPHTVSASAWTGRRRGGHSAQHLRSRSACDRLILAIVLRLRLQLQLQARRCSKKVSLASLARLLQSPNAVHALRAGSRFAAACSAALFSPRHCAKPLRFAQALRRLHAPQRTLSSRASSPLIAALVLTRGARYQNGSDQWRCVEVAALQIMSLSLGKWRRRYAATVLAPRLGSAR
jgi:hypothetical protein